MVLAKIPVLYDLKKYALGAQVNTQDQWEIHQTKSLGEEQKPA
jgi:hypothetical protein